MIDILTLALTHGLMALAALALITREDLDDEEATPGSRKPWQRPRAGAGAGSDSNAADEG